MKMEEKQHEQVELGHQHMLNSTQLSVGLGHRYAATTLASQIVTSTQAAQ